MTFQKKSPQGLGPGASWSDYGTVQSLEPDGLQLFRAAASVDANVHAHVRRGAFVRNDRDIGHYRNIHEDISLGRAVRHGVEAAIGLAVVVVAARAGAPVRVAAEVTVKAAERPVAVVEAAVEIAVLELRAVVVVVVLVVMLVGTRGRLSRRTQGPAAQRLGRAWSAARSSRTTAANAFRSACRRRCGHRRDGAGAAQRRAAGTAARFRRCLAGTGSVAAGGPGRAVRAIVAGRPRGRALAVGGRDFGDRAFLRAVQRTAHREHLVSTQRSGGVARRAAGQGLHRSVVSSARLAIAAQAGAGAASQGAFGKSV